MELFTGEKRKQKNKMKKKTKIIIGILIAAVIAAAGITWYVMNQKNQKTGNSSAEVVAWDVDIEEEEPSEEKGILIPGYTSMVMKANTKEQTVSIGNPADNDCAASMVSGFKMEMLHTSMDLENIVEQVPNLLQRGGMSSMMNTALMAFCGFSFIGALTVCGSMELILERIMKHIHGTGQLITLTVILGVIMITVIGEATVTFLMIGGMFRPEYIKRGLESKNLSRSLEDSITVVEPLVPWSLAGVYMTSVLGVPTVQYAPWAVLCYTGVIFAIIWGFTGFGIAKIKKGSAAYEEYLELSGKIE